LAGAVASKVRDKGAVEASQEAVSVSEAVDDAPAETEEVSGQSDRLSDVEPVGSDQSAALSAADRQRAIYDEQADQAAPTPVAKLPTRPVASAVTASGASVSPESAERAIVAAAREAHLDELETLELAQVFADVEKAVGSGSTSMGQTLGVAGQVAEAIHAVHGSGKKVNPRAVAEAVLDLGGSDGGTPSTDEIIDRLGGLAKMAASKKRRR
jgi:hypothetical protein